MHYDIAIIGGGCVGCAIAQRLAKYDLRVVLLEKEEDVSMGTTKANSGIIHAGYAAKEGTLKADLNVEGNPMFDEVCETIGVDVDRIGSLVCATDEKGVEILKNEKEIADKRGVPTEIIQDKARIKEMEPNLSDDVIAVLYAPTAGVIIPFELSVGLAEHAAMNGVEFLFNYDVSAIEKKGEIFEIWCTKGEKVTAKTVINAAGVAADKIAAMIGEDNFKIEPRRGEYILLDKNAIELNHVLFPTPVTLANGKVTKGIVIAPTLHGNVFLGPNSENIDDPWGTETTTQGLNEIITEGTRLVPGIPLRESITNFAGVRASCERQDFVIEHTKTQGFVNVGGIESPGLSACLSIAKMVESIVKDDVGVELQEKSDYIPKREKQVRFTDLSPEELHTKIKENPQWGTVVCRCEKVTEAEIVEACNAIIPSKSIDMIKRRLRPGMGRCQGGFCQPKVMKIISRERKIPLGMVTKKGGDSRIVTERTKGLKDQVYKEEVL